MVRGGPGQWGGPIAIPRIITGFGALMVALFLLLGNWSWQQVAEVADTAQAHREAAAQNEIESALNHLQEKLEGATHIIAQWGETRQQFADATFYPYWRDKRVFTGLDLPDYIERVALYDPDGRRLGTSGNAPTMPSRLPDSSRYIQPSADGASYFVFHPISAPDAQAANPIGFVGLRAQLLPALRAIQGFRYVKPDSFQLALRPQAKPLALQDVADRIQYHLVPQSGVEELGNLARNNLIYTTGLAWGLGATFFAIVYFLIARPMRTLASHIAASRAVAENGRLKLPDTTPLAETEEVRRALMTYEANLSDLHARLHDKNQELWHLAHRDPLTELPNRRLFQEHLETALADAGTRGDRVPAILYMDLDGFKDVNDSLGHPVGDTLLREIVGRLRPLIPEGATMARVGGDEFLILVRDTPEADTAAGVARSLLDSFRTPFTLEGHTLHLGASIGISLYPEGGRDATALVKNADAAVFRAKDLGRNQFQFYSAEMTASAEQRLQGEAELRQALDRGELRVFYQPQIDLDTGHLRGVEALVRWQHPERGLLGPGAFLPLAEETGLIRPLSDWVLEEACRQAATWHADGLTPPFLAVNLCADQIQHTDLVTKVDDLQAGCGLPSRTLELEVTEDSFMADLQTASDTLQGLRKLGVRIAIDDFGIGSSSLAYLKRLPIDMLKVDKSFIVDAPTDPDDQGIVRAIVALGASMDIAVLAEGVETEAQEAFLRGEGCKLVQGFGYGYPMPEEQLRSWLTGIPTRTLTDPHS